MLDVTKPVTLADLERYGKLAWVYCNACGRERDVQPADLGLHLDTPVPKAGNSSVRPAGNATSRFGQNCILVA